MDTHSETKILVIVKDKKTCRMVSKMLKCENYNVLTLPETADTLKTLLKTKPEILLIDDVSFIENDIASLLEDGTISE